MDTLTIIVGLVVLAGLPRAISDLKRMARAMRLYTHITGAVSAPKEK